MADDDLTTTVRFTYNERAYTLTNLGDQLYRLMSLLAVTLGILNRDLGQMRNSERPEYEVHTGSAWQAAGLHMQIVSISYRDSLEIVGAIAGDATDTIDLFRTWVNARIELVAESRAIVRVDKLRQRARDVIRDYVKAHPQGNVLTQVEHNGSFLEDAAAALVELSNVELVRT